MIFRFQTGLLVLFQVVALLFSSFAMGDGKPVVTALLSERSGVYSDLAESFKGALGNAFDVRIRAVDDLAAEQLRRLDQPGTLVVPVGIKAARAVLEQRPTKASILSLMVSRAGYESLQAQMGSKVNLSAVYIDQPLSRSLALIRLLLPDARRVGFLQSPETESMNELFRQQASRTQFILVSERIQDPEAVPEALQRILPKVDVFLLQADSIVVNSDTVRYILLANYRQQMPVIGFSRGMVKAGAVAAVVSDPDAIALQGATLARQWNPLTGALPAPVYASQFTLVFNYPVARSLGVAYPVDGKALNEWRKAMGEE